MIICLRTDKKQRSKFVKHLYSGTCRKRPPLMSGLGGRLREVSLIAIWLTEFWLAGRLREMVAQGASTVVQNTLFYKSCLLISVWYSQSTEAYSC